jgi:hypothetical protein
MRTTDLLAIFFGFQSNIGRPIIKIALVLFGLHFDPEDGGGTSACLYCTISS